MVCDRKKKAFHSVLKFPEESMIFIKICVCPHQMSLSKNEEEKKNTERQCEGYHQHNPSVAGAYG